MPDQSKTPSAATPEELNAMTRRLVDLTNKACEASNRLFVAEVDATVTPPTVQVREQAVAQ
jgi:hypothetical protein